MHINLQQIDTIYMITAMLLEIPNIAEKQFTISKKVISRNFLKMIEQYDQRSFHLAAETQRDTIVMAARQLNKSKWQEAVKAVFDLKCI